MESSTVGRVLYGYVIPWVMVFLLVAVGIYFLSQSVALILNFTVGTPVGQQAEIGTNQQIFKDVLQTVLAIAAIGIAAFGYGTYKILSSQIEEKVISNTEARYQKSLAYHRAALGYMNGCYTRTPSNNLRRPRFTLMKRFDIRE